MSLVIVTIQIVTDNQDIDQTDSLTIRENQLNPKVSEENVNDSIEIEISDLASVILTWEGKNVTNPDLNATELWLHKCGIDYSLKLIRQIEIKMMFLKIIVRYWFLVFLLAFTTLTMSLIYIHYKEYKYQQIYSKFKDENSKYDDKFVNCNNRVNTECKKIQKT